MSCGKCKCCEAGTRCAHVLVLDRKDVSDLARFERLFGSTIQRGVNLAVATPAERARRADPPEPVAQVRCGECAATFAVLAYAADVATRHRFRLSCPSCAGRAPRAQEAWAS